MIELAWAAGLWDGEGCAGINHKSSKPIHESYLVLQMSMCTPAALVRFANAVGCPEKVSGPYSRKQDNHSDFYKWSIVGERAEEVADLLLPFLSSDKAGQIARVRDELATRRKDFVPDSWARRRERFGPSGGNRSGRRLSRVS